MHTDVVLLRHNFINYKYYYKDHLEIIYLCEYLGNMLRYVHFILKYK